MCLARFFGQEETGAVDYDVRTHFVPFQCGRILNGGQADFLAINYHVAAINRDIAIKTAMHGVVLQHVSQVVRFEQVVDGNDLDVFEIFGDSAEHHASDTPKPIDTHFNCHDFLLWKLK